MFLKTISFLTSTHDLKTHHVWFSQKKLEICEILPHPTAEQHIILIKPEKDGNLH